MNKLPKIDVDGSVPVLSEAELSAKLETARALLAVAV